MVNHAASARSAFLKIEEVAELFNCSETTIRRLVQSGRLPFYRLGHGIRLSEDDIESYIQGRRSKSMG